MGKVWQELVPRSPRPRVTRHPEQTPVVTPRARGTPFE